MAKQGRLYQAIWTIVVAVNGGSLLFLIHALWAEGLFSRPFLMTAKNDSPLGSDIPSPLRPLLDSQNPLLVVAFGQCSECTVKNLNGWVVMLERWKDEVKGVIVAKESERALRALAEKHGWKVPIVSDEQGKILQRLNAYFLPRSYGFSPEGKLVWKQESLGVTDLEAIRSVVEAVKGKGYVKRIFDIKPAWAKALGEVEKGRGNFASSTHHSKLKGGER